MITGNMFVTPHAVARYIVRVRRDRIGYSQAVRELAHQVSRGHKTHDLPSGLEQWRGPKPLRIRFRVDPTAQPCPAVVTVMTDCDSREGNSLAKPTYTSMAERLWDAADTLIIPTTGSDET